MKFVYILFMLIFREIAANELFYKKWRLKPSKTVRTIDQAIKEYYENHTKLLNIRVQLDYTNNWQHEIIDNWIKILRKSTLLTYIVNIQNSNREANQLYDNNVFYVDSYKALLKIMPNFLGDRGSYAGRYMIFLRLNENSHNAIVYMKEMQRIMEKLFEMDIIDVNIVVVNTYHQMVLYSYDVFTQENCRDIKPKVSNYFINGNFMRAELFPKKIRNFHECKLTFLARNVPPFFNYIYNDNTDAPVKVHGVEAEVLKAVRSYFNFTAILKMLPSQGWGDVFENGTVTGPFEYLNNRSVDALMGFFAYEPRRIRHFGQSIPYILSPIVVVINKKQEQQKSGSTWVLDPFNKTTWLVLMLIFLVTIALLSVTYCNIFQQLKYQRRQKYPTWLEALGSSLGLSCPIADGGGKPIMRFCIALWNIGFIIVVAAYAGKLFVAYNRPVNSRPMTLKALKAANYTFLLRKTFNSSYLLDEVLRVTPDRIVRISTNDANDIYDHLTNFSGKAGAMATNLRIIFYMLDRGYYKILHMLPETLRIRQTCAYFRSHSYLIQPFNDLIGKMISTGLLNKWYQDTEYKLRKKHAQSINTWASNEPQPLNMSTYRPVFVGFLLLLFFAFLSFISELIFYNWRRNNRQKKWQTRIHKLKMRTFRAAVKE